MKTELALKNTPDLVPEVTISGFNMKSLTFTENTPLMTFLITWISGLATSREMFWFPSLVSSATASSRFWISTPLILRDGRKYWNAWPFLPRNYCDYETPETAVNLPEWFCLLLWFCHPLQQCCSDQSTEKRARESEMEVAALRSPLLCLPSHFWANIITAESLNRCRLLIAEACLRPHTSLM